MLKTLAALLGGIVFTPVLAQSIPTFAGPVINFLPPAVDATAGTVAFGSTVTPQGDVQDTPTLYVSRNGAVSAASQSNVTSVGLTANGARVVFTDVDNNARENVATLDLATGVVRRFSVNTQGCVRPLAVCFGCFFSCVNSPHATSDGRKILYAVSRNQPFFTMNGDGSENTNLPVYSGSLAPAPQRVISDNGLVVFTSAAPFGPTFAAAAADVYVMNLDGSNIRNVTNFGNNSSISASNAVISADGGTIVFERNFSGGGSSETQVWAVKPDGTSLRPVASGSSPSITADGGAVVLIQNGEIWRVSLTGTFTANQLTTFRFSVPRSPVMSADGSRVVFLIAPDSSSGAAVYEVNSDGTGLTRIYAPRAISPRGVVSAAGVAGPPSPGGLLAVYGINFTSDTASSASAFPLPETMAGVAVNANGRRLPMVSASPWQINAQLPPDAPAQLTDFQVSFADGTLTPAASAQVTAASPAVFTTQVESQWFVLTQAAVVHSGTATLADDAHPAQAGEVLEIYGTGIGATNIAVPAGQPSPANPPARALVTPVVTIGGINAHVLFAGLAPGLAGVAQINIVVPSDLKAGRYVVSVKTGGVGDEGSGTIAVK